MNPNDIQPQQPIQPDQPVQQPQQPQVGAGGAPSQPNIPTAQPIQPNLDQQSQAQPMGSGNRGHKLLLVSKIMSVVILVLAGIILLAAHFISHKIASTPVTSYGPTSSSSSAGSSSASNTTKSACDLFSLSDAQAIMGSSATAGAAAKPTSTGKVTNSVCNYQGQGNISYINIILTVASSNNAADAGYEATLSSAGSDASTVSGVGDKAFYGSNINTLAVLKDTASFTVLVSAQDGSNTKSQATQVANKILSNF